MIPCRGIDKIEMLSDRSPTLNHLLNQASEMEHTAQKGIYLSVEEPNDYC